ncbi:MAG: hypothetical protein C4562_05255 [Actinobacteria bacterium]|nr:MAG: hypothetical protein C4562_05255 [Actinomycetota bacterium]
MQIQDFINSKNFKIIAAILAVFVVAVTCFASGIMVGLMKARFSYRFGANYERNFMPQEPPGPFGHFQKFLGRGFRNAHGVAGKVISISDNKLIIKDRDNKENTVLVNKDTTIKDRDKDIKLKDIKKNDELIVIGNPSDKGVLEAVLIRIFDFKGRGIW